MRIRRIVLALGFLFLAACRCPVDASGKTSSMALHSPQTAPLPSQLHTLIAAKGRW